MKKEKWFVICFVAILFGVLGCYGVKQVLITLGKSSVVMTDNWQFFEPKEEKNKMDVLENKFNSLKTSLENRTNNYFPFYIQLNELYQGFNYKTNALFYENIPIKTNSDGEYLFYNQKDNFYYLETNLTKEELDKRLEKQVSFFNTLAKKDLNIYIYIPTRYELTTLKKNNLNDYISTFEKKLDSSIHVAHMDIKTTEEYKSKFYNTDHHWNIRGALDGYNTILNMLYANKIENFKVKEISEVNYYGSMAKTAMDTSLSDKILDADIELDYDVLINGEKKDNLFKPRVLATGKSNVYYDYYVQYFNGQYGNIVYDYHQPLQENLLILSDSYAWQIDYLIAASFNKTHVINLRYDEYKNGLLDIEEYVKENNISKVLFLYEGGSTLFDQYDYDFVGKVR